MDFDRGFQAECTYTWADAPSWVSYRCRNVKMERTICSLRVGWNLWEQRHVNHFRGILQRRFTDSSCASVKPGLSEVSTLSSKKIRCTAYQICNKTVDKSWYDSMIGEIIHDLPVCVRNRISSPCPLCNNGQVIWRQSAMPLRTRIASKRDFSNLANLGRMSLKLSEIRRLIELTPFQGEWGCHKQGYNSSLKMY